MSFPSPPPVWSAYHLSFVPLRFARCIGHHDSETRTGVHSISTAWQVFLPKTPSPSFRKSGKPRAKASIWSRVQDARNREPRFEVAFAVQAETGKCASSARARTKIPTRAGQIPGTWTCSEKVFAGIRSLLTSKTVRRVTDVEQNLQIQFYAYAAAQAGTRIAQSIHRLRGRGRQYHVVSSHVHHGLDFDAFEEGLLYAYLAAERAATNTRRERCFRAHGCPLQVLPRAIVLPAYVGLARVMLRIWRTRTSGLPTLSMEDAALVWSSSLKFGRSGSGWTALCAISHGRPPLRWPTARS